MAVLKATTAVSVKLQNQAIANDEAVRLDQLNAALGTKVSAAEIEERFDGVDHPRASAPGADKSLTLTVNAGTQAISGEVRITPDSTIQEADSIQETFTHPVAASVISLSKIRICNLVIVRRLVADKTVVAIGVDGADYFADMDSGTVTVPAGSNLLTSGATQEVFVTYDCAFVKSGSGMSITDDGLMADFGAGRHQVPPGDHKHLNDHRPLTGVNTTTVSLAVDPYQKLTAQVIVGTGLRVGSGIEIDDAVVSLVGHTHAIGSHVTVAAKATIVPSGSNNSFVVKSATAGASWNGVKVRIQNDSAITTDDANASYDSINRILTVKISSGTTKAQTVVTAINGVTGFAAELVALGTGVLTTPIADNVLSGGLDIGPGFISAAQSALLENTANYQPVSVDNTPSITLTKTTEGQITAALNLGTGLIIDGNSVAVNFTQVAQVDHSHLDATALASGFLSAAGFTKLSNAALTTGSVFSGLVSFSGTNHFGLKLNSLTTAQRNGISGAAVGNLIWNTTTGKTEMYTGASWKSFALAEGDTFTGLVQFAGTGHAGLKLNALTTGQRDALTPASGNVIWNTTTSRFEFYSGAWKTHVRLDGDTMTGLLQFSGTTHVGLKLNSIGTPSRDALSSPGAGSLIWNTTTARCEVYNGTAWKSFVRLDGDTWGGLMIASAAGLSFNGAILSAGVNSGILTQRNGSTAQRYFLYNLDTDTTTFERGRIGWAFGNFEFGTDKGSAGGAARAVQFFVDGVNIYKIETTGHLLWNTTDTYNIGSLTNRPNNVYAKQLLASLTTIGASANSTPFAMTGYAVTTSVAFNAIDISGAWNTSGDPVVFKANLTNGAGGALSAGAGALFMDFQDNSVSKFKVDKAGGITALYQKFGSGSPEGVVAAPVGAHYHRTDGGAGTSFYVKESGAGSSGWIAK